MNRREIFQRYFAQRKCAVPPGYVADCVEGLVRYTPTQPSLEGIVMFSELSELTIGKAISAQLE